MFHGTQASVDEGRGGDEVRRRMLGAFDPYITTAQVKLSEGRNVHTHREYGEGFWSHVLYGILPSGPRNRHVFHCTKFYLFCVFRFSSFVFRFSHFSNFRSAECFCSSTSGAPIFPVHKSECTANQLMGDMGQSNQPNQVE